MAETIHITVDRYKPEPGHSHTKHAYTTKATEFTTCQRKREGKTVHRNINNTKFRRHAKRHGVEIIAAT